MEKQVKITPELNRQLKEGVEHYDIASTLETLNTISGKYLIGDISIEASLGHFALLVQVDNPLLCPGPEGKATMDEKATMEALYILDMGEDAIDPLLRIKQNEAQLADYYELLKGNESMAVLISDVREQIIDLKMEFERQAREHFSRFDHLDFEQIVRDLVCMTKEILEITEQMPEGDKGSISKKKHSALSS